MEEIILKHIEGKATLEECRLVIEWVQADQNNREDYESLQMAYLISIWNDLEL